MIKNIPKSAVWKKSFPVYKQFTVSNSDYEVISGSLETGSFETGSFNKQGNVYTHPLIKSIIHKYYGDHSNPFTMYAKGFQRSEFLLKKGFIDHIIPRNQLKDKIYKIVNFFNE